MRRMLLIALLAMSFTVRAAIAQTPAFPPAMFSESGPFGAVVHTPFREGALEAMGVQWVRLSVRWGNVEKEQRGQYDWADTEKLLNFYLERGFRVMAVLTMENLCPLYEEDKGNQDLVIDAIAQWAGAAALHFKGKNILWELSNEPEVFPMGGYWDNPVTYTKMAREAAATIKAADPDAKVAALSVGWFDRNFMSQSFQAGLLSDGTIDVLTYHGYHRRTLAPESGLAEDVRWLQEQIDKYAPPGKHVIMADSERGYAIIDFLKPKHWASWRNLVYSESEQAAYCARHYLETIWLGVEIAVWYKDMSGEECFSLYYGTDEDPRGLRPMGHVYRNLAALLPENPKSLRNDVYTVSLVDPPDQVSAPDGQVTVRTYLRSFLQRGEEKERLVVALWFPVESFDGRILDSRKKIGDNFYEAWRAVSPDDLIQISTQVRIADLARENVTRMSLYDLRAAEMSAAMGEPLGIEVQEGAILSPTVNVSPMPTLLVVDISEVH